MTGATTPTQTVPGSLCGHAADV